MFSNLRRFVILLVAIGFMTAGAYAQQPGSGTHNPAPVVKVTNPQAVPRPAQTGAPSPTSVIVGPPAPATGPQAPSPTPVTVGPPAPAAGPQAPSPTPVTVGPLPGPPQPTKVTLPVDPYANQVNPVHGYPGDASDPSSNPADLTPQNPVGKSYEQGKIQVRVGSVRHFGYRLGDEIPITIWVLTSTDTRLDFTSLQKGSLAPDGSDFEVADCQISSRSNKKQRLWQIDLQVRSFVPQMIKKGIVFNADFLYALNTLPDQKKPNWKRLTTPDFLVTTSNTADNGTDLLEGNTDQAVKRISWFTYPVIAIGLVLFLYWPVLLALAWYRRKYPPKVMSPNEEAWDVFDRVFANGKQKGFTTRHYRLIARALRKYLGIEHASLSEVTAQFQNHPQCEDIVSALRKCESVLYANQTLTPDEHFQLRVELMKIVPRP